MCRLSDNTVEDILSSGAIYEVGGAVRDKLLHPDITVKDRDYLVTGVSYDDLSKILRRHGRVDLVGRSFGVIKFTQSRNNKSYTFDITLPRTEYSMGVGHRDFQVDFNPNLRVEDDLKRRDFTVNAMAMSLKDGVLIDPLGGQQDLEKRQLRMISDESFRDDPLRMARAVQLAARFDFEIESETLKAMTSEAELIRTVSPERIAEELEKLLTRAVRPSIGLRLMQQTGLLKHILPELEACVDVDQPGGYHKYDVFEHILRTIDAVRPSLRLRLAALFHDIRKPQAKRLVEGGATFYGHEVTGARIALDVMGRLRFGHDLARDVATLVERHMFTTDVTEKGLRRLLRRVGPELIFDLLDLRRADVIAQGMGGTTEDVDQFEADIRAELDRKPPLSPSDLALDGNDVMKIRNLSPGPVIGTIIDGLMEAVLDDPSMNEREKLERFVLEFDLDKKVDVNRNSSKESDS